jgi:hypothetical protein
MSTFYKFLAMALGLLLVGFTKSATASVNHVGMSHQKRPSENAPWIGTIRKSIRAVRSKKLMPTGLNARSITVLNMPVGQSRT